MMILFHSRKYFHLDSTEPCLVELQPLRAVFRLKVRAYQALPGAPSGGSRARTLILPSPSRQFPGVKSEPHS